MISQDQFFELIALVSSESKKVAPLLDQSMEVLSEIEVNFSQLINEQAFQDRSELKSKLNEVIAEAQLQVNLPMLSNRHNLIVISKNATMSLEILYTVSKYMFMPQEFEQAFKRIALLKLPVVVYHSQKQEPSTVYNLVDNVVSLELARLCAFLSLGDRDNNAQDDLSTVESKEGQDSCEFALVKPSDLAQLCAVPWEFKDEFKDLNLIFMSSLSQNRNHLRLLSMSQSALVIPSEDDEPCNFGNYPLDVKVFVANNKQELARNYIASCKGLAMRKGQGPLQIDTIGKEKLVSFLKSKSQSSTNLNLLAQLLEISRNLILDVKHNGLEVKSRIEKLNRFLLESHVSAPFVHEMLSKAKEQQQNIKHNLNQNLEINQAIFDKVNELFELFSKRGFIMSSQNKPATGSILAWRQLFELGAFTQDVPLMRRSIQARIDCDERVKTAQKLYVDFLDNKPHITDEVYNEVYQHVNDQGSMCSDLYRQALIRLCYLLQDQQVLNRLSQYVTESVPLERRNAQENLLVGMYLTAKNYDIVNNYAKVSFEKALAQGELAAIDYLVTPYLKEVQDTNNNSKLRSLALTYNPKAAFEYACHLQDSGNPEFEAFILIAVSQSYEPALISYADFLYQNVLMESDVQFVRKPVSYDQTPAARVERLFGGFNFGNQHSSATYEKFEYQKLEQTPLSQELELKAQHALNLYTKLGSKVQDVDAKIARLLYTLNLKFKAVPYLERAAKNYDAFSLLALSAMYLYGDCGFAKDLNKAYQYAQHYASQYRSINGQTLMYQIERELQG